MLKIAITGSTGLVGSRIVELLNNDFKFIPLNHQDGFDITDRIKIENVLKSLNFDFFLHLAAYTNVDKAEINKENAYKINVDGTKNVFEVVKNKSKKFVYISTGFVFDGNDPPYDENSQTNPLSVYGQTKHEAEKIVNNKGMIVRIDYPYGKKSPMKKDFVQTIKSILEQNKNISMITNTLITPTYIDDIAYGLKHLFNNYSPKIYHLVGSQSLSPLEAGLLIANHFGLNKNLIQPTTSSVYFYGKAKRPQYAKIISVKNNFYKMLSFEKGLKNI